MRKMDNQSDILSSLLSDPAALASAMEIAKGFIGNMPKSTPDSASDNDGNPSDSDKTQSVPSPVKKAPDDDRTRLLLALKPYLSPKRSEKVGTVLALMKGLEMIGGASFSDWGK